MLEKILSANDCAACKLCCGFFESEIWEVPVIDDEVAGLIEADYDYSCGERVFKASYDEKGLCLCPALEKTGCKLDGNKPFDCKIWPFRAMKLGEFTVVTVSPLCKKVSEKPLSMLSKFVIEELAEKIKARVEKYPAQVKDYVDNYPILAVL